MIGLDKKAHFLAGAAIAATVALYLTPALGLAAGIAAGIAKELYDRAGYGTPDIQDFIATAFGATVVLPAILLQGPTDDRAQQEDCRRQDEDGLNYGRSNTCPCLSEQPVQRHFRCADHSEMRMG